MAHTFSRTISYIDDNKREEYLWQKPHCYPAKTGYGCPLPCPPETDECPNHPDLYFAQRRRCGRAWGAIADYYGLRGRNFLDEIFLDVAEDEMEHYAETMRLISWLDQSRPKCSQKKLSTCW